MERTHPGHERSVQGLALGVLATWRLAHLLSAEDGPLDVVARVRERVGSTGLRGLLDCFNCTSVWVSAAVAPLVTRRVRDLPLTWLALSGAACLLERLAQEPEPVLDLSALQTGDDDDLLPEPAQHDAAPQPAPGPLERHDGPGPGRGLRPAPVPRT